MFSSHASFLAVVLGTDSSVCAVDLRSGDVVFELSTDNRGGVLASTLATNDQENMVRVGTDAGLIATVDIRSPQAFLPDSVVERKDGARILSFCGKSLYSTSLGDIGDSNDPSRTPVQVAEFGDSIVSFFEESPGLYVGATTSDIIKFKIDAADK